MFWFRSEIAPLAAFAKKAVQDRITRGMLHDNLQWDNEKLPEYVEKLSTATVDFQDLVDELSARYEVIQTSLSRLEVCRLDHESMRNVLKEMQDSIKAFDKVFWCLLCC